MQISGQTNAAPVFTGYHLNKSGQDLSESRFALTIPWSQGKDYQQQDEYACLASRLPLKHYWDIPRFLLWTLRIRHQLKTATGLVGYSLKADLLKKTFWTLSAWDSEKSMETFVRSGAHKKMLADMKGRVGIPAFSNNWSVPSQEIPLSWEKAKQQLALNG